MTDASESPGNRSITPIGPLPAGLSNGSTVLLASVGDPTADALGVRVLSRLVEPADTALVVTTTESADETVARADRVFDDDGQPSLGLVDTGSTQQSVESRYGTVPTVFTPSPGDLERLVVALTELSGEAPPATGGRHLLVRSLTPILEAAPTEQVCSVLQQVSGIRTDAGITLFGIDETAHDDATMDAIAEQVEGVLWVTDEPDGTHAFDYRPTTGRFDETLAPGP